MATKPQRNILAAGDSFIGIFSLYKRSAKIDIQKFKGGTAKGILKSENENRLKLIQMTTNIDYKMGIFNFGQVDVHHSFYYNIFAKKQAPEELIEIYKQVANEYVDFIASLEIPLKIIAAVSPSPLATSDVPRQLLTYGILEAEEIVNYPLNDWWTICNLEDRHSRLEAFNTALETACERHKEVTYVSFNNVLTNPDKTVKLEFIDLNPVNPHLLWEPLICLWADYLDKFDIGVSPSMLPDMEESSSAYNKKKIIEVGDQTFFVGPKMRVVMDYLTEKERYFYENQDRNLNTVSNISTDCDDNDDEDFAIALSQHESKLEDLNDQMRKINEQRALEKVKSSSVSAQEISKKISIDNSILIPIPPPNIPSSKDNDITNNKMKKNMQPYQALHSDRVVSDNRNLISDDTSASNRQQKNSGSKLNVTELWPVLSSTSTENQDDCESRNSNHKSAKISSNNDNNSNNKSKNYNVSNDRHTSDDYNHRNRSSGHNYNDNNSYHGSSSSSSHNSNDRSSNSDYRNRNISHSNGNDDNDNKNNNHNNKSNDYRNDHDYRNNNNCNRDTYSSNNNNNNNFNNRNNNNISNNNNYDNSNNNNYNNNSDTNNNNNNSNSNKYNYNNKERINSNSSSSNNNNNNNRSQTINYRDESEYQVNKPRRLILSDQGQRGSRGEGLVLSDQGQRGGRGRRDEGLVLSDQGQSGRGYKDQGGGGPDTSRLVLSDQGRRGGRGRDEGDESDDIQGVQTLSLSDRFQMFNNRKGKTKDR